MSHSYFPWRLYRKFFTSIVISFGSLFVISLGIASYVYDFSFYSPQTLWKMILWYSLLSICAAAFLAYQFALPLRNVILKALRISSKKYASEFDEEDVLTEQPGEYVELEQALDKMRRKLQKRRLQLSHEREESQALIRSSDEAIISVGVDEKILFFNASFGANFLSKEFISARGTSSQFLLTECFREPEVLALFRRAFSEGVSQSRNLKLYSRLDAQQRHFGLRVSPLREENSSILYGVLATFHDITEIKRAEQIRIEFVENASHELRTPLTAIKGFLEAIREDFTADRMAEIPKFLNIVCGNVDRLASLVNDMLTISSLESNSGLKLEGLNLQEATEEVVMRLSKIAAEKEIAIKMYVEAGEVQADAERLDQILTNLIGNAIKYGIRGGLIEVKWSENPAGKTILSVKDNGPGIAPEHQSRLFERFYRVDKGRSRDVGGTGLGLSIVKHIMQSHGGQVYVLSELGRGSEFICIFPR